MKQQHGSGEVHWGGREGKEKVFEGQFAKGSLHVKGVWWRTLFFGAGLRSLLYLQ